MPVKQGILTNAAHRYEEVLINELRQRQLDSSVEESRNASAQRNKSFRTADSIEIHSATQRNGPLPERGGTLSNAHAYSRLSNKNH